MKKSILIFLLVLFASWSAAMAEIDPEEILRQLPPPEVTYTLPEIRAVKPPVTLPDYSTVEYYGRSKPSTKELERSLRQIKSLADSPAVSSTIRLIKHLSDDVKAGKEESTPTAPPAAAAQAASHQSPAASTNSPTAPRAVKPPPVAAAPATPVATATPSYPPPTGNLMSAWQTLRKNPGLTELEESLARDRQLAEDTFTMAMQLSAEGGEPATEEEGEGESAPAGSHDAVLATAIGLYKQQDWKGLKGLFAENPEAGETKDGLRYIIEAEINEAKPNYMQVRRYSDQLHSMDENDAMANYGLALYHYNAKKPDTAKAGEHLAVALKAKNPPQGASALYWKMTFNKFMIPLLLVVAGLIGGISHVIKKKKAAAIIDLDKPVPAEAKADTEAKPQGKLMQKLAPLLDKFKDLLARFKKKKTAGADVEKSASKEPEAADGNAEVQEIEESADDQESSEEESEDDTEEENELESEDEEAVTEDSEEEGDEEETEEESA